MVKTEELRVTADDAGKTITVLHGQAPTQYGDKHFLVEHGDISAPAVYADCLVDHYYHDFHESTPDSFEVVEAMAVTHPARRAIITINNSKGVIRFESDKHSECNVTIIGRAKRSQWLEKIIGVYGINAMVHSPNELRKIIRSTKVFFGDVSEWADALKQLESISGKLTSELKNNDDGRGNKGASFEQTLQLSQNTPQRIQLKVPLIENQPEEIITIELVPDSNGGSIVFKCECWDLERLEHEALNRALEREARKLKDLGYVVLHTNS